MATKLLDSRSINHKSNSTTNFDVNDRPTFSSQDYEDKVWEANVMEEIENPPKASQGSSQYDDPELIALIQSMQM